MAFVKRLSTTSPTDMTNNPWWYSTGNIYYPQAQLPNCTCYAYGRYAEIRNGFANLPGYDAGEWFYYATSFNRGVYGVAQPQLGCVICFGKNPGSSSYGHVAIVEEINYSNGEVVSIKTSNSGYGGSGTGFFTEILYASQGYISSWMQSDGRDYYCQGFIYNDAVTPAVWHAKSTGTYVLDPFQSQTQPQEAIDNASLIVGFLTGKGWSNNACYAAVGNACGEGGLNPWSWQNQDVPANLAQFNEYKDSDYHGYGLWGDTPASNYINATNRSRYLSEGYAPQRYVNDPYENKSDGQAQTARLNDILSTNWGYGTVNYNYYHDAFLAAGVDIDKFYWMRSTEFKDGVYQIGTLLPGTPGDTIRLDYLVGAFMLCYEKPWVDPDNPTDIVTGYGGYNQRVQWAQYFSGISPTPPTPPTPTQRKSMPLWMMLHYGL